MRLWIQQVKIMRNFLIFFCLCFELISSQDLLKVGPRPSIMDYHRLYEQRIRECEYCSLVCPSAYYDNERWGFGYQRFLVNWNVSHSDKRTTKHFQDFITFFEKIRNPNDSFGKGMNLSGRLEPAFYVEEPNYIILRNEEDNLQNLGEFPFLFKHI